MATGYSWPYLCHQPLCNTVFFVLFL
uniref:Uncharacterized protein n=1 Tax=Anguilla anguilla TaxID=7936 RepID=A0A0E9QI57_ANGAN